MKVRVLTGISGADRHLTTGDVLDMPDDMARRYARSGAVVIVSEERAPAVEAPKSEAPKRGRKAGR